VTLDRALGKDQKQSSRRVSVIAGRKDSSDSSRIAAQQMRRSGNENKAEAKTKALQGEQHAVD